MIRLIIFALGIFVIWVLFGSDFSRRKKIIIVIIAFLLAVLGLWFEQRGEAPREGRIDLSEVQSCGASATHSYRSNFDVEYCLQNNSTTAVAKRVALAFIAQRCVQGRCTELQSVNKEVPITLAPSSQIKLQENLRFDQVDPLDHSIVWTVQVTRVKAVYQ